MKVSVEFLQQVRDECYAKSLKCFEVIDLIDEHQEIPIIGYCKANNISPSDLSFEQQKAVFDAAIDRVYYDAEFYANAAEELDKLAYIKILAEIGLENIPTPRSFGAKPKRL